MKQLIIGLFMISGMGMLQVQAQAHLDNFPLGAAEIVAYPFGMEYPVKLGTVTEQGDIQFDFPEEITNGIPPETVEMFRPDLSVLFFFSCDDPSVLDADSMYALPMDPIAMVTADERYAGVLFPLSHEDILPWLEDQYYMEPVKGSFVKLIYTDADHHIAGTCHGTRELSTGVLKSEYTFDVELKKGFNFINYEILEIHKTDPNETSSIPSKVKITSTQDSIPDVQWKAKYF